MAKVDSSFFKFQGKLGGLVFVKNATHGTYVRMPRGTYKKATLNKSLQRNADRAKVVTTTAQTIYKALDTICGSFRQKDLWPMLLKRMYKSPSNDTAEMLKSLEGLEMNETYPYSRILPKQTVEVMPGETELKVSLKVSDLPVFPTSLQADNYQYSIQVMWLG